jgi:hypothetical protein
MRKAPVNPIHILLLIGFVVSCKGSKDDEECGTQTCPAGTAVDEYRSDRSGVNISAGGSYNPGTTSVSGKLAYANYGSSECRYTCVAFSECPPETWPVIDNECFTCATINDDGEPIHVDCGD